MKHIFILVFMTSIACLFDIATTEAADEVNSVCKDVGELAYGTKKKCVKGDLIIINTMLSA